MAGNSCCFRTTSLNVFKNTSLNVWAKCRNKLFQSRRIRVIDIEREDKKQLEEYFRKPFLGDSWSGLVVPKKDRLL